MKTSIYNNSGKLVFVLLSISLFLSFIFGIDSIGSGGMIADFYSTWPYVEILSKEFYALGGKYSDITPLGYMVLSWFYYIFQDQTIVRLIYCYLSILLLDVVVTLVINQMQQQLSPYLM